MAISLYILYGEALEAVRGSSARLWKQPNVWPFHYTFCTGKLWKLYGEALEDSWKQPNVWPFHYTFCTGKLWKLYGEALEDSWKQPNVWPFHYAFCTGKLWKIHEIISSIKHVRNKALEVQYDILISIEPFEVGDWQHRTFKQWLHIYYFSLMEFLHQQFWKAPGCHAENQQWESEKVRSEQLLVSSGDSWCLHSRSQSCPCIYLYKDMAVVGIPCPVFSNLNVRRKAEGYNPFLEMLCLNARSVCFHVFLWKNFWISMFHGRQAFKRRWEVSHVRMLVCFSLIHC